MNRIKAVQQALDGRVKRVYLEIGVAHGVAFRRITADEKIAVDPAFKLSARSRRLANAKARASHYFETTSDAFFTNETAFLEQHGIDIALLDGLHTCKQALRDVENTLRYLRTTASLSCTTATPQTPRSPVLRCRTPTFVAEPLVEIRLERRRLEGDRPPARRPRRPANRGAELRFGVGLIRKGFPESRLSYSAVQIEALNYSDLAADRDRFLT